MKNKLTLIAIFAVLLVACEKTELTGETKILQGNWQWTETYYGMSTGQPIIKTPETEGYNLELEFLPEGNYILYKGDKKEEKGRVIITEIKDDYFELELNKTGIGKSRIYTDIPESDNFGEKNKLYCFLDDDNTLRFYRCVCFSPSSYITFYKN